MISQSSTLASYISGNVFVALGSSSISFTNTILAAEMTSLQWRSLFSALLSAPYLIVPWIDARIIAKLGASDDWGRGYAMWAMIREFSTMWSYLASMLSIVAVPACTLPVIAALFWLSVRAPLSKARLANDSMVTAKAQQQEESDVLSKLLWKCLKSVMVESGASGLILLGLGWYVLSSAHLLARYL